MTAEDYERETVRDYVQRQTHDETVDHLEQIASRHLLGKEYRIWDVWTDQSRWWVISPLTNLYLQSDFQSLEMAFTYHLGVLQVLTARGSRRDDYLTRSVEAWRKLDAATDALDEGREPEDFQAVGMRLREGLLAVMGALAHEDYVTEETDAPKEADFVGWADLVADAVAPGANRARLRAHLKGVARTTWSLVAWLTHTQHASRSDAEIALSATDHLAHAFVAAEVRRERGPPEACPNCGSYRIATTWRPESHDEIVMCEVCDWEMKPSQQ